MGSNLKRTAFQKYDALIADMNNFERINYEKMLARGTQTVNRVLKRNILALNHRSGACGKHIESKRLARIQIAKSLRCFIE